METISINDILKLYETCGLIDVQNFTMRNTLNVGTLDRKISSKFCERIVFSDGVKLSDEKMNPINDNLFRNFR